ncbi:MAG: BolA family transcriptional regulator [Nevskia sp.]|nr:BolA family transcriptional regulator [Nevskia sp.]
MSTRIEVLRKTLESQLQPLELKVVDESAQHVGHAGAARGGGHFRVYIVCQKFSGRTLIARHRMVYEALSAQMREDIHALSIVARAPEEVSAPDA